MSAITAAIADAAENVSDGEEIDLSSIGSHHQNSIDHLLDDGEESREEEEEEESEEEKIFIDPTKHKACTYFLYNGLVLKIEGKANKYTIDGKHEVHLPGNPLSNLQDKGLVMTTVLLLIEHCDEHRLFITKPPPPGEKRKFSLPTHEVDGVTMYKPKPDKVYKTKAYKSKPYGQKSTLGSVDRSVPKQCQYFTVFGENEKGEPVKVTFTSIIAFATPDGGQISHPSFGMKTG